MKANKLDAEHNQVECTEAEIMKANTGFDKNRNYMILATTGTGKSELSSFLLNDIFKKNT